MTVDIEKELRKGYLMFRAFENGLEVANAIKSAAQSIEEKKVEAEELAKKNSELSKAIDSGKAKANKEIEDMKAAAAGDIEEMLKVSLSEKANLEDELKEIREKTKAAKKAGEAASRAVEKENQKLEVIKAETKEKQEQLEGLKDKLRNMLA